MKLIHNYGGSAGQAEILPKEMFSAEKKLSRRQFFTDKVKPCLSQKQKSITDKADPFHLLMEDRLEKSGTPMSPCILIGRQRVHQTLSHGATVN